MCHGDAEPPLREDKAYLAFAKRYFDHGGRELDASRRSVSTPPRQRRCASLRWPASDADQMDGMALRMNGHLWHVWFCWRRVMSNP